MIGSIIGAIPGTGSAIAATLSYQLTKKIEKSDDNDRFSSQGIISPEAANSSMSGGALIPMLTLGIPGDPVTAVMLGALTIHGLEPGPLMISSFPEAYYGLLGSFAVSVFFLVILTLIGIPFFLKAIRVKSSQSIRNLNKYNADAFLFDTYSEHQFGGTGKVFQWELLNGLSDLRIILSGGLNINNISDALKTINPNGIDVNSGIELFPGKKDKQKINNFFNDDSSYWVISSPLHFFGPKVEKVPIIKFLAFNFTFLTYLSISVWEVKKWNDALSCHTV